MVVMTLDEIKKLYEATVVTKEELEKDRTRFYDEKYDPPWLFKKKYGKNPRKKVEDVLPSVEKKQVQRLTSKDISFLLQLNKVRSAVSGKNHMRQLRAEALYARQIGEKISRTPDQTVFSDGVRFNLDGEKEVF